MSPQFDIGHGRSPHQPISELWSTNPKSLASFMLAWKPFTIYSQHSQFSHRPVYIPIQMHWFVGINLFLLQACCSCMNARSPLSQPTQTTMPISGWWCPVVLNCITWPTTSVHKFLPEDRHHIFSSIITTTHTHDNWFMSWVKLHDFAMYLPEKRERTHNVRLVKGFHWIALLPIAYAKP